MTCYHLSDKTSINPQSAFCIWRSAFCTERISVDVFVRASLKSEPKYWSSKKILERPSWSLWVVCGGELLRKSTSIEQWLLKSNWRRTQMRGLPIWLHLMLFARSRHGVEMNPLRVPLVWTFRLLDSSCIFRSSEMWFEVIIFIKPYKHFISFYLSFWASSKLILTFNQWGGVACKATSVQSKTFQPL